MKPLLLADIPPCSNYTGGIALAQQCRHLAPGELAAFVVLNSDLAPTPYEDLAWIPTAVVPKPRERRTETFKGLPVGRIGSVGAEFYKSTAVNRRLVAEAVRFGRAQRVDAVWAMVEGQTVTRMALPLARALGVPLFSQVWDPLSWWLKAHAVDRWNSRRALATFDRTIRASRRCATASWAMAEHFEQTYGVPSLPVITSHDPAHAKPPGATPSNPAEFVIGMLGQFYAPETWRSLTTALDGAGWRVGGRTVKVFYMGSNEVQGVPAENLINAGWRDPLEAISLLSINADVCYVPYPFEAAMEEVARFSFPSKAVLYMASGRPIFCHAPRYSSPARYFTDKGAAVVCSELGGNAVFGMLNWLARDRAMALNTAIRAHHALLNDFSPARQRESFFAFLRP